MGFPTTRGWEGGMILPHRKSSPQGIFPDCLAHPPQISELQSNHGNRKGRQMIREGDPLTRGGSFVSASRESPQFVLPTSSALGLSVRSRNEHSCYEPVTSQSRMFLQCCSNLARVQPEAPLVSPVEMPVILAGDVRIQASSFSPWQNQ